MPSLTFDICDSTSVGAILMNFASNLSGRGDSLGPTCSCPRQTLNRRAPSAAACSHETPPHTHTSQSLILQIVPEVLHHHVALAVRDGLGIDTDHNCAVGFLDCHTTCK
jgi:hypothetical protein